MDQFPRSTREREATSFRDTPVMMTLAAFRKPTAVALPKAREIILKWAREQHGEIPEGAEDGKPFDLDRPGDPVRVITPTTDPNGYWALRLNRVDHEVAGRIWTVEVHLASSGSNAHFGFRMSVLSEGDHALRAPRFIRELDQAVGLQIDGFPLDGRERLLRQGKATESILDLIESDKRSLPVIVFSSNADGDAREDAAKALAKLVRGLAHVCVMDEQASYQITKRFGKGLSTYLGAIRVYPPHFTAHADPFSMPMYPLQRTERVSDNRLADWLMHDVCTMSVGNFYNDTLPRFSTLRKTQTRYELNRARSDAASSAANSSEQVEALRLQIAKFGELEALFNESLGSAENEAKVARSEADELKSENYRLRAHVESLMDALRADGQASPAVDIPDSYEDLQIWADKHYPTSITITNKAARLAADSEFEDVATVYKALQLLATDYRDSKRGIEGAYAKFEAGLEDLGLQITPAFANGSAYASGSDAVLKYRGVNRVLDWHIKNGGNTRDPARCLRIYFFWSEEDQACVVGALPAHIRTVMS